jgi:DNA-binding transcriptional regulator GbsR (MarR family)
VIKILINDKACAIFWFLWKNRDEPYTIREISRQTKVSYGSTWSLLKEFEEWGLVHGIEKKRAHLYILNFDSELCFHVWSFLNALKREKINDSVKRKALILKDGFSVYYQKNKTKKVLHCSKEKEKLKEEEKEKDEQWMSLKDFKELCATHREVYNALWNTGIVITGEKAFYTVMWDLAEKKVIGVGI